MESINIDWEDVDDVPREEVREKVHGFLLRQAYEENPNSSDPGDRLDGVNKLLSKLDELEGEDKLATTIEIFQLRVSKIADSPIEGNRYSASPLDCSERYSVKVPREIREENPDYCFIRVDKSSLKSGRTMPRAPLVGSFNYEDIVENSRTSSLREDPAELH